MSFNVGDFVMPKKASPYHGTFTEPLTILGIEKHKWIDYQGNFVDALLLQWQVMGIYYQAWFPEYFWELAKNSKKVVDTDSIIV